MLVRKRSALRTIATSNQNVEIRPVPPKMESVRAAKIRAAIVEIVPISTTILSFAILTAEAKTMPENAKA